MPLVEQILQEGRGDNYVSLDKRVGRGEKKEGVEEREGYHSRGRWQKVHSVGHWHRLERIPILH